MKNKVFCKKHGSPSRWRIFTRAADVFIDFGRLFWRIAATHEKATGLPRVNPILVFAADQHSTTSTVAHCKSIGSLRRPLAAGSKNQISTSPPCARSFPRPVRSSNKYFLSRLPLNDPISRNSSGWHHSGRCSIAKSKLRTNFALCILPI